MDAATPRHGCTSCSDEGERFGDDATAREVDSVRSDESSDAVATTCSCCDRTQRSVQGRPDQRLEWKQCRMGRRVGLANAREDGRCSSRGGGRTSSVHNFSNESSGDGGSDKSSGENDRVGMPVIPPRETLPEGWSSFFALGGREYFFHAGTSFVQWERPTK